MMKQNSTQKKSLKLLSRNAKYRLRKPGSLSEGADPSPLNDTQIDCAHLCEENRFFSLNKVKKYPQFPALQIKAWSYQQGEAYKYLSYLQGQPKMHHLIPHS